MKRTKAQQIAAHLNEYKRPFDYRQVADAKAAEIGVAIYWAGTAAPSPMTPCAEVWQVSRGCWTRRLGLITRGHDDVWRA